MLNDIVSELRHGVRALWRSPGFTCTVIVTLTLAIGANVTVFTLANALILASLPVPHPERLLEISTLDTKGEKGNLSIPAFQSIERQAGGVFANLLAWNGGGMENLEMNGALFPGSVDEIAGDYYSTLGIRPALGRFITPQDIGLYHFTPSRVAVIGYRDWQERYHGDAAVLGKTILINGKPFTIIGVHPRSFPGLIREVDADATVPLAAYVLNAERLYDPKNAYYTVIGRLRDGVDLAQARALIETIWPSVRQATVPAAAPERDSFLARRIQVEPAALGISYLRERFTRPLVRTPADPVRLARALRAHIEELRREYPLRIETVGEQRDRALSPERTLALLTGLFGGLALLLAAVGLYGLLSYTVSRRTAEIGIRGALGATRRAVATLVLKDVAVLLAIGLAAGLAIAFTGARAIAAFLYGLSSHDPSTLLFAAVVLIVIASIASLLPAIRAARIDPAAALRHE